MPELPGTIVEAGQWLRSGKITATELTEALLARCHAAQERLGAFNVIMDETAMAAARAADAAFTRGIDRGPLMGIPLAIKDLLATSDAPTTANSRVLDPAWGQRADATVVRKLRAAGMVPMGKTVLHEFAIGWPDPATGFPIARNPWDPARTPGGSSSGTGTAVCAGLVLGGLGSDTGGSIRGPASYCGISGLKPTFGRVSKEGAVPLGYSLDTVGPMARTARDCAIIMDAIAGYDPADPCTVNLPVPSMTAGLDGTLAGVRIGIPRDYFFTAPELEVEVKTAVLAAVDAMRDAGATVVEIDLPHSESAATAQRVTISAEAYAYHEEGLRERPELYGMHTRLRLMHGLLYTAADFLQAQRVRSVVRDAWTAAMRAVDVLIVPTSTAVAPTFASYNGTKVDTTPSFTGVWNLVGFPALSVGCGFSTGGLPIGMQIVGAPFTEPMLFRIGDAYQRITDWHTRVPNGDDTAEVTA
ncbi:MAG: amidase family protein [Chloroflexota bacterium]|nr:amidase family protein [Chloroflexota bacterium]